MAHGTSTADNVVSFITSKAKITSKKHQKKQLKRRRPFVKVSYDSGSDADAESDDDHAKDNVEDEKPIKKKLKTPRKKQKRESSAPIPEPEIEAEELSNVSDEDDDDEDDDVDDVEQEEEFQISEPESEPEETPRVPGAGWADVMAKILQRDIPKEAPTSSAILAKSKEYEKAKLQEQEEYAQRNKVKVSRDQWEQLARVKPKVTDKDVERKLQRIATRGVVQLFNAVKKEQKQSGFKQEKPLSVSERRRAEEVRSSAGKGNFLDLLKGTPVITKKSTIKKQVDEKQGATKKPSWSVLQDNFMMGATMKDWDKQSDSGSDGPGVEGSDMNSFSDSE